MIQELLGTPTLIGGERKILPFNCGIILEGTPNPPFHPNLTNPWETPSSSSLIPVSGSGVGVGVSTSADAPSLTKNHLNNPSNSSPESNKNNHNNNNGNNLRCPRCDSSNTKFCYYNNYNLAQPRHFCKTCRRYWTKGGALRNVPIGGGCHKSRPLGTSSTAISGTSSKSGGSKFKTLASEPGRPSIVPGFNHEIFVPPQPIPVFLASGPYNSHILSFFKGNQNPNPNHGDMQPAPAFLPFNEETTLLGSFPIHGQAISAQSGANERSLGIEPVGHHHSSHFQQQNCVIMGDEIPSSGVRSLFRRLGDLTGNNYYNESNSNSITPGIQPNTVSTNIQSLSSPILESVPATTSSEPGYWNPAFSVSDLQMTNGAYP